MPRGKANRPGRKATRRDPEVLMVAYDIRDAKRLRQVYRIMRGYGDHIQYSVFRCVLSDVQRARLERDILGVIAQEEDQVLFVPLGRAGSERSWRAWTLGVPLPEPERCVLVI